MFMKDKDSEPYDQEESASPLTHVKCPGNIGDII